MKIFLKVIFVYKNGNDKEALKVPILPIIITPPPENGDKTATQKASEPIGSSSSGGTIAELKEEMLAPSPRSPRSPRSAGLKKAKSKTDVLRPGKEHQSTHSTRKRTKRTKSIEKTENTTIENSSPEKIDSPTGKDNSPSPSPSAVDSPLKLHVNSPKRQTVLASSMSDAKLLERKNPRKSADRKSGNTELAAIPVPASPTGPPPSSPFSDQPKDKKTKSHSPKQASPIATDPAPAPSTPTTPSGSFSLLLSPSFFLHFPSSFPSSPLNPFPFPSPLFLSLFFLFLLIPLFYGHLFD